MRTSRLGAGVLSVLQFLSGGGGSLAVNRGRWELDVNKGRRDASHHTWVGGRALTVGWAGLCTVSPQGNDDLALHSTNKTIQTML